jgi:hypothetical protein
VANNVDGSARETRTNLQDRARPRCTETRRGQGNCPLCITGLSKGNCLRSKAQAGCEGDSAGLIVSPGCNTGTTQSRARSLPIGSRRPPAGHQTRDQLDLPNRKAGRARRCSRSCRPTPAGMPAGIVTRPLPFATNGRPLSQMSCQLRLSRFVQLVDCLAYWYANCLASTELVRASGKFPGARS